MSRLISTPLIALLSLFSLLVFTGMAACDDGDSEKGSPSDPRALETQSESANGALPAFSIRVPAGVAGSAERESSSFSSQVAWETKGDELPKITVAAYPPPQATNPDLIPDLQTGACAKAGTIVSDTKTGDRRAVVCQASVMKRGGVRKDETRVMVSWMHGETFVLCRAIQTGKADRAYLESICDSLQLKP